MTRMTWEEAIVAILAEEGAALHYTTIAERIMARGLRRPLANPAVAVLSALSSSLRKGHCRFQRTVNGEYMLLEHAHYEAATPAPPSLSKGDGIDDTEEGAIQALEMAIAALDALDAELLEAKELHLDWR
jgi:hypothetical protein